MLDKIILFSIKNKLVIGIMTMMLIIWGIWSASRIPVDALPDVTNNQVQVITTAPTLAAQEVEQFITYPIEKSLANIQGVVEMRSFSRFGLSVITIVFDETVNVYFARQLISEKLKDAEEEIPAEVDRPQLAPVTTGLGEIYQYVIHPKKGSENKYTAMDLRTIQDWIVARQLSGIKGVAEVTGFGGISKQYEVAVDPQRLKAMNVTMPEIFTALQKNNENTGGAYIDKKPNAYFIRGVGMVKNFTDIENIVVKKESTGIPVLVRDVATVQFGSPPRYGAMTYNGEKEVVGGLVLMMKGANSASVVNLVKERMETIRGSLPADVEIDAFIDRTNLIDRAIGTVKRNLIEGALIVIFVLVLFLGNLRAGLIVASAIPLSLLFAFALMNLFGVSANLMSLGAIDFGLIVDGAVIIVEATMHHLGLRKTNHKLTQGEMDHEVFESASKIRNSAAFGEIIILIVYLPILTLQGVEGKMFRPMAQTVVFAILGALILSVTYIPMISAFFLPKSISHKKTFADKMMDFFQRIYSPVLKASIRIKYVVIAVSVALLILTIIIFNRLGGEFIPTLEEGDYAIEFLLPQGASISQTIETVLMAEKMLMRSFPEVKMIVGKTGAADVATDPMPPQASDLLVIMKDKKEWKTTDDFYEMADMMRDTLSNIPGVIAEPSQPIQMRFNELMTGIRQDVAIKIFGEDLDTLAAYGDRVANAIRSVEGITQPQVERIAGLPQITVQFDRTRLASYGLNIEDVNHVISTGFAGEVAGVVYENERKFDLVLRLDSSHRTSLNDVSELNVPMADGNQIPLSQVATVSFETGPAQISREAGKRRIFVSFNVNGRDVESVVKEVQQKLDASITLPAGYYYTYGGTFENLQQASRRLQIVVPLALLLIFFLLYLTFHSIKEALLIFTAIPMSAIGGVFALLLRGMPFSISAGVGFIALFGVAVLNGIVLISTFNQLEKAGMNNVIERVIEGTKIRLRPVLMTAMVASLGFLPMALSTGAGAEVQKPLATVVIGGLITATILTLIVLPLLYITFANRKRPMGLSQKLASALALLFISPAAFTQSTNAPVRTSFNAVYDTALSTNLQLRSADIQIARSKSLTGTWLDIPKTGVFAENEDLTPEDRRGILKIGVSQSLEWPTVYKSRRNLLQEQVKSVEFSRRLRALEIRRDIQQSYYTIWYLQHRQELWKRLDSMFYSMAQAARLKVKTGESAGLDSISAIAKSREIAVQLNMLGKDILTQQEILRRLTNANTNYLPPLVPLSKIAVEFSLDSMRSHPAIQWQNQNINIANAELQVQKQSGKPTFDGRFFSQRLYGIANPYSGFSVSVGIPLFGKATFRNRVRAAELEREYQRAVINYEVANLNSNYNQAIQQLRKDEELLTYYETTGLAQAEAIIKAANIAYRAGEISFADLSQFFTQAIDIQKNYLEVLNQYNQSAIQLNYYLNR